MRRIFYLPLDAVSYLLNVSAGLLLLVADVADGISRSLRYPRRPPGFRSLL